jgi:hypothetical protein
MIERPTYFVLRKNEIIKSWKLQIELPFRRSYDAAGAGFYARPGYG